MNLLKEAMFMVVMLKFPYKFTIIFCNYDLSYSVITLKLRFNWNFMK